MRLFTKNVILLFFCLFILNCTSSAQVFEWVKKTGASSTEDIAYDIAVDNAGNTYITGRFQGTIDFDPGPGVYNITMTGGVYSMFVQKLDALGNFQWAFCNSAPAGSGITVDGDGNVYVVGEFGNTVDFDPGPAVFNLTANYFDAFLLKLDTDGNFVWAKKFGATGGEKAFDVALGVNMDVVVVGYISDQCDFDPGPGTYMLNSDSLYDAFVVKVDTAGAFIWAGLCGGMNYDQANAVAVDLAGNIFVTGSYRGIADFDPGAGVSQLASASSSGNGFIVKLNSSGIFQWAGSYDTPYGIGWSVTTDNTGACYVTGDFNTSVDVDPGSGTNILNGLSSSEGFISKLAPDGTMIWGRILAASTGSKAKSIITDNANNIYVVGSLFGTGTSVFDLDLGPAVHNVTGAGAFLLKMDFNGNFIWGANLPGTGNANSVRLGFNNDLFVSIFFSSGTGDFDPGPGIQNLTAGTWSDYFIARYSQCTAPPTSPAVVSGSATICSGSTTTFSTNIVTGATSYSWSLPSGWGGTSYSNSINVLTSEQSGNVGVTANNGCGSSPVQSVAVNVLVATPPVAIVGNTTICAGSVNTYSIAQVSGAISYAWSLPSGWTGSSTDTSIVVTSGTSGGSIRVQAYDGICFSDTTFLSVSLLNIPAMPGAVSGATNVCAGTSYSYSVVAVPGATSYTWTLPSGWTGNSTTNSINTIPSSNLGNIIVTANNSCGTSLPRTKIISSTNVSVPVITGDISGNDTVCSGSSNSYSISTVTGADSYVWTKPTGWSGSSGTANITLTANSNSGFVTVRAVNGCGTSLTDSLAVLSVATPSQPGAMTGNTTICSGSSNTYSVAPVSGAASYSWTLPSGWSGSSTVNSIVVTAGTSGGNIIVRAVNSCGTSSPRTLAVAVTSIPSAPGAISGNDTICAGNSISYSITSVSGATSYLWTLPSGWSGSSTSISISATANDSSGNLSVAASNSCGTSPLQNLLVEVVSVPATPASIVGNSTICSGVSSVYSTTSLPWTTSYNWILPSGWSGTSNSDSITVIPDSTGSIQVSASNFCGTSGIQLIPIVVFETPDMPDSIFGDVLLCSGLNSTYYILEVNGAVSYSWTLPSGWIGASSDTSILITPSLTSGNILVEAINVCGTSNAQVLAVSVTETPAQPVFTTSDDTLCSSVSENFVVGVVPGATSYTWTLPSSWTGGSSSNSITFTPSAASGLVSVVSNNICGSSSAVSLNVIINSIPIIPNVISGEDSICASTSSIYSISPVNQASSYNWILPSGWTGSSSDTSINITSGLSGGTIQVSAINECGSSPPQSLAVTVISVPGTPGSITGLDTICSGISSNYSAALIPGATSYLWNIPAGWSGGSNSNSVMITPDSSDGTLSISAINSCGSSTASLLNIEVISIPSSPTVVGATDLCEWEIEQFSVSPVYQATSYNWSLPLGWLGSSVLENINVTVGTDGGIIVVSAQNVCGVSPEDSLAVNVTNIDITITQNVSVLSSNESAGSSYQWVNCPSYTIISGANLQSFSPTVDGDYAVIINKNNCADTSACVHVQNIGVVEFNRSISAFPNPVKDIFIIDIGAEVESSLEIFSALGVSILKQSSNARIQYVDVSELATGIYFLVCKHEKRTERIICIKE